MSEYWPGTFARRSWPVIGLAALIAGVPKLATKTGVSLQENGRPECPRGDSLAIKVVDEKGNFVRWISSVSASGPITGIPEFHDCQRFVVGRRMWPAFWKQEPVYDSLYAIFAAFRLDTVPDTSQATLSIPVATIYSYGGTYASLGIRPGFNCLFLTPPKTSTQNWTAQMVSVADSNCLNLATLKPHGTPTTLEARRTHVPAGTPFTINDYPAVARWDWGKWKTFGRQHIGIRCGHAWCEVGAPGFTPSDVYAGPAVTFQPVAPFTVPSALQPRVTAIKGWYDAQMLDIVVSGQQIPSKLYGVMIPSPWLDVLPRTNVAPGLRVFDNWVQVADVWIQGGDYKGNLKAGMNEIWLCHERPRTTNRCGVPLAQPPLWPPWNRALAACDPDPDEGGRWWAKIVPPAGTETPRYRCVKRRSHLKHLLDYEAANPGVIIQIPGAARWRWLLDDAGEWARCGSGCCTGQ